MILRNTGKSKIYYKDGEAHGEAGPNSNFEVSDPCGRYLKKLYPRQIENLEDAVKKFAEDKKTKPTVAAVAVKKKSAHEQMQEELGIKKPSVQSEADKKAAQYAKELAALEAEEAAEKE